MTVGKAIENISSALSGNLSAGEILGRINTVESMIQVKIRGIKAGDISVYSMPEDTDTALILPEPYDLAYLFYAAAAGDHDADAETRGHLLRIFSNLLYDYAFFYRTGVTMPDIGFLDGTAGEF